MPGEPFSLRLDRSTITRLTDEAVRSNLPARTLAQELVEEGLRMRRHPGIVFVSRVGGRRAVLAKRPRLSVANVVETLQASETVASAAEFLSLELVDVERALAYYAEFREEIDVEIRRRDEYAEREERLFRERQHLIKR